MAGIELVFISKSARLDGCLTESQVTANFELPKYASSWSVASKYHRIDGKAESITNQLCNFQLRKECNTAMVHLSIADSKGTTCDRVFAISRDSRCILRGETAK
ncbi:hypothetical protein PILCRDRAFT_716364 [Piloderma croceum F 1598]|uniref:Uncharacterized protein n=1 Tax=Piloderma croceum (strain F 1598) TaxID=765440 RepID=A0A0C3B9C9_PILCF|nr:hypothetical protein PILCRDRAFT_716364 [Piloderma croceum F 1598]